MSRSVFLLAASSLALVACQPAQEPEDPPRSYAPPPVEVEEVAITAEALEYLPEETHDDHSEDADHDEGEHDEDAHAHDDDHDDHSGDEHEDHDHHDGDDHEDHDHDDAGGEAHVHGLSDLAASLDGETLSVSVEGALANFDLDESLRMLDDGDSYAGRTVQVVGGDCTATSTAVGIRPVGDHGNLVIDLTYLCSAPGSIEGIEVTGFQNFAGFEQVNAVYLTDAGQSAETLTEGNTRLDIN